jgi:hypothetical protein
MTYKIAGLDPTRFAHLVGLSDDALAEHGAIRVTADSKPGFPCRISLTDAEPGETLLLVNHVSHDADTPYRAAHAIFINEAATRSAVYRDALPPVFTGRVLSLRAFDRDGMMHDAALALPGEADEAIRRLLADAEVDHIDAHNAARGCFAARIDRG